MERFYFFCINRVINRTQILLIINQKSNTINYYPHQNSHHNHRYHLQFYKYILSHINCLSFPRIFCEVTSRICPRLPLNLPPYSITCRICHGPTDRNLLHRKLPRSRIQYTICTVHGRYHRRLSPANNTFHYLLPTHH